MVTIELTKLLFNARHGFYEEEKILGGSFEVNASILHPGHAIPVKHIHETIDYTAIYEIISARMSKPTPLLETLASEMALEILAKFSQAEEVSISIKKINPPIIAFQGSVGVTCTLGRKDLPASSAKAIL